MKTERLIVEYFLLITIIGLLYSEQIYAQKPRIHNKKLIFSPSLADSAFKQCISNNVAQCKECDTSLLKLSIIQSWSAIKEVKKDKFLTLAHLGNTYHVFLLLALCRSPHVVHIGNIPHFYSKDTLIVYEDTLTLQSLQSCIFRLSIELSLPAWFSLWNGTVSGAHPPKKSWKKNSLAQIMKANAKAYFAHSKDEYSIDMATNIIRVSERLLTDYFGGLESVSNNPYIVMDMLASYMPESDAAFIALHKQLLSIKSMPVSDKIAAMWHFVDRGSSGK